MPTLRVTQRLPFPFPMVLAVLLVVAGCTSTGVSADNLTYTELPGALDVLPSGEVVQLASGQILARSAQPPALLRLEGTQWQTQAPDATHWMHDWSSGRLLGLLYGSTLGAHTGEAFTDLGGAVPSPPSGWLRMHGIDSHGAAWITEVGEGTTKGSFALYVTKWQAPATMWTVTGLPIDQPLVSGAQFSMTMTRSGRLFFPTHTTGLMEVNVAAGTVQTRVPCTHPMLRASHPDYQACQEDTYLLPDRDGGLLALNPNNELWRISADGTEPSLVVNGTLPNLPRQTDAGYNRYRPGGPSLYADPVGRVWMLFRWGENDPEDTSYLYVWDPAAGNTWTFLRGDLGRVLVLHGDGEYPLISSLLAGDGLRVWRVQPK